MEKNEIFEVLLGKEKVEVYHKFLEVIKIDNDVLYSYYSDLISLFNNAKSYVRLRAFIIFTKISCDYNIDDVFHCMVDLLDCDKPTIIRQALRYSKELPLQYRNKVIENVEKKKYLFNESMLSLIRKDIDALKEV